MLRAVRFILSMSYSLGFDINFFLSVFGLLCLVIVLHCGGCLWILVRIFLLLLVHAFCWAILPVNLLLAVDGWLQVLLESIVSFLSLAGLKYWKVDGRVCSFSHQSTFCLRCLEALRDLASLCWRLLHGISCSNLNFSFEQDEN